MRPRIPIWVAALGEKNVAMTAEVADGWLPLFFVPDKAKEVFGPSLAEGRARRDASLGPLQIAAGGLLAIGEESEVAPLRELGRPMLALYIGGMGAKGRNFYNALACRYGYEKEAAEIQDLYLAGRRRRPRRTSRPSCSRRRRCAAPRPTSRSGWPPWPRRA